LNAVLPVITPRGISEPGHTEGRESLRWACRSTSLRKERALLDLKCVEFVEELIYEQWRKKPLGK
jgi:hypothetical protein